MKPISKTPITILVRTYLLGMLGFSGYRLLLLVLNLDKIGTGEGSLGLVLKALFMGLRFDTVICCYLLFLPTLFFVVYSFFPRRVLMTLTINYLKLVFILTFFLSSVDVPYFMFHSVRLSKMTFSWLMSSPSFVLQMVFSEPRFWLVGLLPFALISTFFVWGLNRALIKNDALARRWWQRPMAQRWFFIPLLLVMIVGARGRLNRKSPIRTGTAFFSNNMFANVLGLNPVYTLMNSLKQKESAPLVNPAKALAKMKVLYNIPADQKDFARSIRFEAPMRPFNVVLVIMESMAAKKTGFLNGRGLTPKMDALAARSLSFTNAYTLGVHTFNGIYSTLFSLPSSFGAHPMKVYPLPKVGGLATSLKQHGYSTQFFIPHDAEFDNIAGFLTHNDFDRITGESQFPKGKVLSTLGVPDHVMFDESFEHLAKLSSPFLAVYMTASDHGPYVVPDDIAFKPTATDEKDRTTQYADWAIGKFMADAQRAPWFDNTLFVLVADHGSPIEPKYDIPLNYHHTPLLFFMPKYIAANSRDDLVSQLDIFPTIMGLLRAPYVNRSLGLDVLSQERKLIPLNGDDVIGALGREYLYAYRNDLDTLVAWKAVKNEDLKSTQGAALEEMKDYTLNFFQAGREIPKLSIEKVSGP